MLIHFLLINNYAVIKEEVLSSQSPKVLICD